MTSVTRWGRDKKNCYTVWFAWTLHLFQHFPENITIAGQWYFKEKYCSTSCFEDFIYVHFWFENAFFRSSGSNNNIAVASNCSSPREQPLLPLHPPTAVAAATTRGNDSNNKDGVANGGKITCLKVNWTKSREMLAKSALSKTFFELLALSGWVYS